MKRLGILLLLVFFATAPYAQKKRTAKPAAKKTVVAKKPAKTSAAKKTKTTTTKKKKAVTPKGPSVQNLQNQRKEIQQQIKVQEQKLRANELDVKKRLQNLMVLNTEIEGKRRTIDTIRHDISNLDIEIERLSTQLDMLQSELMERKQNYVKSMRYMHRNKSSQSQLMFIFSADNMTQMFRHLRFMREYASYQRVQGEKVKDKQEEVNLQFQNLNIAQEKKRHLLSKGEQERRSLEG